MKEFNPKKFLQTVTNAPGVYQMYDSDSKLLYIGKARNLKKRLSSYFQKRDHDAKTQALVASIADIQVMVAPSDRAALLHECELIKRHKPPYNIVFRDDKGYAYLYLSTHHEFPQLKFYRGEKHKRGTFFGPYPSAQSVKQTIKYLQKTFKLRSCSDSVFAHRSRPCMEYQIKRCSAPCVEYVSQEDYQKDVDQVLRCLRGQSDAVITELTDKMQVQSDKLDYESAKESRDQIVQLQELRRHQGQVRTSKSLDVIAVDVAAGKACVQHLKIRDGKVWESRNTYPSIPNSAERREVLKAFIEYYYFQSDDEKIYPKEVLLSDGVPELEELQAVMNSMSSHKVTLRDGAVRGERASWLLMAVQSAKHGLNSHLNQAMNMQDRFSALEAVLPIATQLERIECFDISHTQGEATVASCVVFSRAGAMKSHYRRFNIRGITAGDDYAAMQQAIERRYQRQRDEMAELPDLVLIDGDKKQASRAVAALQALGLESIQVMGIAKGSARKPGLETLWFAATDEVKDLPADSDSLHLLQQIRDEAHRFAISGHRKQRQKLRTNSVLEVIPGVGGKRRRALLTHFGGMQALKTASKDEIAKVPGISQTMAEAIFQALR